MPEKKITASKDSERRMTKPQVPKPIKTSEPARTVASRSAAAVAQPLDAQKQLSTFEAAMKLFHARKLQDARELFALAAQGPERDVANRARLHLAMCDRRLQEATVNLGSAEDYYNYGIALLNTRNVSEARTHLDKALQMAPGSDHIHYALALAQALGGDIAGAHDNLKRAIELEPRNRLLARQDTDFAPLANQHPLHALLYPEKKGW
jgi:tetratricopeptide (TPR) repeat protein